MSDYPITVMYDGDCPICSREMAWLMRRDRGRRIQALDIADGGFDAGAYGLTSEQVNARIHALLPGGRVIEGMEVLRRLYRAVGRGWMLAWTGWPVLKPICDYAYGVFAKNRYRITGRGSGAGEAGMRARG